MSDNIIKLSKSRINTFIMCPYKYYLRYSLNIRPQKKNIKLVIGLTAHKVIEEYLIQNKSTKEFVLSDVNNEVWSSYSLDNTECDSEEDLISAKDVCQTLVERFINEITVTPWMIEHSFSLPMINLDTGEQLEDIWWCGRMDFVDERSCGAYIVDIKTKSKSGNFFDIKTSLELTGYAYSFRMETGEEEAGVSLINLIKTKIPKVQQLDDKRYMDDFIGFFYTIKAIADNIQNERFYQNPGLHCSFCDYRPFCARDFDLVAKRFGERNLDLWQEGGTGNRVRAMEAI